MTQNYRGVGVGIVAVTLTMVPSLALGAGSSADLPKALFECNEGDDDLKRLLVPGSVVFFGEIHGTQEAPDFLGNVACLALDEGKAVTVGLEVPHEEEGWLAAFLSQPGSEDTNLDDSAFWKTHAPYGLASQAVLSLVERIRAWHRGGHPVRVTFYDRGGTSMQQREQRNAAALRDTINQPEESDAIFLILTGNIHSRIVRGTGWDEAYEPMAYLVQQALPSRTVVSLDLSHAGGEAWVCLSDEESCGPRPMPAVRTSHSREVGWTIQETTGHHGFYHVGAISNSPPALWDQRQRAEAP